MMLVQKQGREETPMPQPQTEQAPGLREQFHRIYNRATAAGAAGALALGAIGGIIAVEGNGTAYADGSTGPAGPNGATGTTLTEPSGAVIHRRSNLTPQTVIDEIVSKAAPQNIFPTYKNRKLDHIVPTYASLTPDTLKFRTDCMSWIKYYITTPTTYAAGTCGPNTPPSANFSHATEYSALLDQLGSSVMAAVDLSDAAETTTSLAGNGHTVTAVYQCPDSPSSAVAQISLKHVAKHPYSEALITMCS
jgi:hypothetical protein